jgi:GntR family transcriptional regulator/MocR family aminotransferase
LDLQIDLSSAPGRSLRARLEHTLREAARSGRLAADQRLPSSRQLALDLGVSRGVVVDTYAQLAAEGYLRTARGGGTRVAPAVARPREPAAAPPCPIRVRYDLGPFHPSLSAIPRRMLAAALARVMRDAPDQRLGLIDPAGALELRGALSAYLGRVRGILATAEQIVITSGTRHGFSLTWQALAAMGVKRVAVESPGWRGVTDTVMAAGLSPVHVPVDDDGLCVDGLPELHVDAVAVAPAHQYPTGAVLSAERRTALLDWARSTTGFVVEDDFDAEYRYDHRSLGALQGLAPERVIYAGSTSKTLAPCLRMGWVAAPPAVRERIIALQETAGTLPAPVVQLALADLLERGELDRHLRRQRRRYREQRAALLSALESELPGSRVRGAAAGLYAVIDLPEECDEAAVLAAARARGISLEGRGTAVPGLVLGYANVTTTEIRAAVEELAASIYDRGGRAAGGR